MSVIKMSCYRYIGMVRRNVDVGEAANENEARDAQCSGGDIMTAGRRKGGLDAFLKIFSSGLGGERLLRDAVMCSAWASLRLVFASCGCPEPAERFGFVAGKVY